MMRAELKATKDAGDFLPHTGPSTGPCPAVPPGPRDIERLRRHPRFNEAAAQMYAGLVEQYEGNWILNRILGDRGRTVMGLILMDLHFNHADEGGLTATRLKQVCSERGVCSPGRVTAILGAMRLRGLLVEIRGEDRRVHRLRPTEKLMSIHRVRRRNFLEALALLTPVGERALELNDNTAFIAGHLRGLDDQFGAGMRLYEYVPELKTVFGRDAGILILLSLVVKARRGDDPFCALDVTISALAKQYSVSRGHVLSVLRDAEEQGMIARVGERGEGIAVTEALLDGLDNLAAALLLVHLAAVRQALAGMGDAQSGAESGADPGAVSADVSA